MIWYNIIRKERGSEKTGCVWKMGEVALKVPTASEFVFLPMKMIFFIGGTPFSDKPILVGGVYLPLKNDGVKVSWDDFPFPIYEMEK